MCVCKKNSDLIVFLYLFIYILVQIRRDYYESEISRIKKIIMDQNQRAEIAQEKHMKLEVRENQYMNE